MTVYEWLASNGNIIVTFDKSIDSNHTDFLRIKMDIGCECVATTSFYGDRIPNNDAAMLDILNQMRQNSITFLTI